MSRPQPSVPERGCPPLDSFVLWRQGQLGPDQVEELLPHLEACPSCVETLERICAEDPISQHLRHGPPRSSEEEKTEVESIVRRMRSLGVTPNPVSIADTKVLARHQEGYDFLSPPMSLEEIGRLGPYRILRLLGQGGMGLVFEAEDVQLRRSVALKVMRPEAEKKPGARERFLREARAAAAVRHDHVITIHHVAETNDVPYLVMELLRGQSLETRCQHGPLLSLAEVARVGREIAEGLAAAHAQGLTHRDIKPDNVWLESPRGRVKLLDFGLARAAEGEGQITQDGLVVGTPAYMAPEQASGRPVDARSDLFSLGCVLYRLVSDRLPFQGPNPLAILQALANETPPALRSLRPEVPSSLSRFVASLLAKRPEDRPQSAHEAAEALAGIERECEVAVRTRRPLLNKRSATLALVAAGLSALAVALALQLPRRAGVAERTEPSAPEVVNPRALPLGRVPADKLMRENVPVEVLTKAGGGDKAKAPPELVGVLGKLPAFPTKRPLSVYCYTRFSPDGKTLATCNGTELCIYDAVNGGVIHRLDQAGWCGWFDFRPDGQQLVVSGQHGLVFWDPKSGGYLGVMASEGDVVGKIVNDYIERGVTYTAGGESVISCDRDGKARLWSVKYRKLLKEFPPPLGYKFVQSPQVHPGGRLVALQADGVESMVQVLDLETSKVVAEVPGIINLNKAAQTSHRYMSTVRFVDGGRQLASFSTRAEAIRLFDTSTWKDVGSIEGNSTLVAADATGQTLFRGFRWSGGDGVYFFLYDVKTRTRNAGLSLPVPGDSGWTDLSPDGKTLAVRGITANTLRLFDATTGEERLPIKGHKGAVAEVDVSPDGRRVVSAGHDQRVLLWDLPTATEQREVAFVREAWEVFRTARFTPDGKQVAALKSRKANSQWIGVWDAETGEEQQKLECVLIPASSELEYLDMAFHPNGHWLICPQKSEVGRWKMRDGNRNIWSCGHDAKAFVHTTAYDSTGERLASGDNMGIVSVWNTEKHELLRQFKCDGPVRRARFSPDGELLAATTLAPDSALYVWNLRSGAQSRLRGHGGSITGLAWNPDGQSLATASHDGTVRVWPRGLNTEPRVFQFHAGKQEQPAFTPEGRHLLTSNEDGSIYVLRLAPPPSE